MKPFEEMTKAEKMKVLEEDYLERKKQEEEICKKYEIEDLYELEFKVYNFGSGKGYFEIAPTEGTFIDYCLEYSYGEDCGDWGKVRELSDKEKAKYGPIFKEIYEGFDPDNIRLVEFCWYNCCEAPDYYDITKDSFYDEV